MRQIKKKNKWHLHRSIKILYSLWPFVYLDFIFREGKIYRKSHAIQWNIVWKWIEWDILDQKKNPGHFFFLPTDTLDRFNQGKVLKTVHQYVDFSQQFIGKTNFPKWPRQNTHVRILIHLTRMLKRYIQSEWCTQMRFQSQNTNQPKTLFAWFDACAVIP